MMHHVLRWTNAPARAITVSHEKSLGVTLQLSVYEFVPAFPDQQLYWYKDATGWQHMATTPFAMKRGLNTDVLEKYIQDHTYYYVENSFPGNPILSEIFAIAWKYSRPEENFLIRDVLQLWTATQLLAHGATLHPSSDALNISPVPSPSAPLANQTPLPRVLANQLDHLLERRVWQLEKQILSELQKRIFGRKREDWLKIFLSLVILMNALERDSWRLYYWVFHMEDGYAWRHPSTPERLIEKNNTLAGSLAAHFAAISKGLTPFALDWSSDQTLALIGHCEDPDSILGAIERIGRNLRSPGMSLCILRIVSWGCACANCLIQIMHSAPKPSSPITVRATKEAWIFFTRPKLWSSKRLCALNAERAGLFFCLFVCLFEEFQRFALLRAFLGGRVVGLALFFRRFFFFSLFRPLRRNYRTKVWEAGGHCVVFWRDRVSATAPTN